MCIKDKENAVITKKLGNKPEPRMARFFMNAACKNKKKNHPRVRAASPSCREKMHSIVTK